MDERAVDLRAHGRRLVAAAEASGWVSLSGDRMKARVAERRGELDATAVAYEEAAAALRRHAEEVDDLKALIENIEQRVRGLISGAVARLRDAAAGLVDGVSGVVDGVRGAIGLGDEPSAADQRLASYAPPPSGDKAWLEAPDELGVRI
ncbi:hypothetical protein [Nocardioides sp.]|uniref:hypothetical protein n=1 Tax=Nocardioides sp. TaxID=35761 RepID=UPI002B26C49A|nr:hypothetical protein [Nocardioides sp.]